MSPTSYQAAPPRTLILTTGRSSVKPHAAKGVEKNAPMPILVNEYGVITHSDYSPQNFAACTGQTSAAQKHPTRLFQFKGLSCPANSSSDGLVLPSRNWSPLTVLRSLPGYFLTLALVPLLGIVLAAQVAPVTIEKVGQPTWDEAGGKVVLILAGQHLDGVVRVKVKHKGIRVIRAQAPDANHLLVWLNVSHAAPGTIMLQVCTRYLTTFAAIPMLDRNAASMPLAELSANK